MASSLKKTKVKLDLLIDIDILLMIEKSIRGGICQAIIVIQKLIIHISKIMIKINDLYAKITYFYHNCSYIYD